MKIQKIIESHLLWVVDEIELMIGLELKQPFIKKYEEIFLDMTQIEY
jgi:hypothetical protein